MRSSKTIPIKFSRAAPIGVTFIINAGEWLIFASNAYKFVISNNSSTTVSSSNSWNSLKNNPQYFDFTIPISVCFFHFASILLSVNSVYTNFSRASCTNSLLDIQIWYRLYMQRPIFSISSKKTLYDPWHASNALSIYRSKQISSKISYFKRILFLLSTIIPSDFNASRISLSTISLSTPTTKRLARSKTMRSTVFLTSLCKTPYFLHLSFKQMILSHMRFLKLFSSLIFSSTNPPDTIKLR